MFYERVIHLIEQAGITKNKMLLDLNLNKSSMLNWEKRRNTPDGDILLKIARYFNVSVDYLLGNDSPASAPVSPVITFTHEEQRVILRYRAMSEEAKLIIRKILDIPNGDEELVPVYHAAHSKDGTAEDRIIYRTRAELDALENAPESDVDI